MTELPHPYRRIGVAAALLILLAGTSCTDNQKTSGHKVATLGEIAPPAAPAGGLIGGHAARTQAITSAGVGAIPVAEVAAYVDRLEADMRIKIAGTGIELQRRGNELLLSIPARIAFDGDRAGIGPGIRTTLDQVARLIARYHQSYVDVSGYADPAMAEAAAHAFGESEAQSLANYLQARGVLAARIGTLALQEIGPTARTGGRAEIKLVPLTEADLPPPAPASVAR